MIHPIGHIDVEGGPVLIGDANTLRHWTGCEGDDYDRLCRIYDAQEALNEKYAIVRVPIGDHEPDVIAWDAGGGGTVDIFQIDHGLLLVRGWVNDDSDIEWLASMPLIKILYAGKFTISSNRLAIFWSPECGHMIQEQDLTSSSNHPTGPQSIDGSCLLVDLSNENYSFFSDEVSLPNGASAIRCWLKAE